MKYQEIRKEIKKLSQNQVELKNQRKTVNLVGERSIPTHQATYLVYYNAITLMHLFHAYAKVKGIEIPLPKNQTLNYKRLEEMIDKYSETLV